MKSKGHAWYREKLWSGWLLLEVIYFYCSTVEPLYKGHTKGHNTWPFVKRLAALGGYFLL